MSWIFNRQRNTIKRLVCSHRDNLYRVAYSWTHNSFLADDLVQQTILKALSNQKQLKDTRSVKSWLFRILANCHSDYYRTQREMVSEQDVNLTDNIGPEHLAQQQQVIQCVRHGVSQLPLPQRQVITLVVLEGLPYATVAEILDIPVGTVMSRISRAREALKVLLVDLEPKQASNESIAKLKRIK